MKILVVSPTIPYPLLDGIKLRVFNLFKYIGARHEVSLIYINKTKPVIDSHYSKIFADTFKSITTVNISPKKSLWQKVKYFLLLTSDSVFGKESFCKIKKVIDYNLKESNYDLIYVFDIRMLPFFINVKNIPIIVDVIDASSLFVLRSIETKENMLEKIKSFLIWLHMLRYERKYLRIFKNIITTSPADAKYISTRIDANIHVVPNGVDFNYFKPLEIKEEPLSLVFTGVMNYPPNVEAMVYFIKNILPQIKRKVPDIKLTMAGKKAAPLLKNLAVDNKNITITGFVNDIRPFIGKANVYICPMVSGAGIKNKILEAWAMGKAIVATSLSCQAISEAKHNKNVLISDDPKGFSEFVVKLLKDEKLREKLGRNGRNLVKQKYNWPESAEKILGIIKKIQS